MPIEFIPNQPFIFESALGAQCLNNDNRAYAQLVQAGDTICVQEKMVANDDNIICEPDFIDAGAVAPIIGAFTVSGGWSWAAGVLDYDGTGGVVGRAYQGWAPGVLKVGNAYVAQFTIVSITGNASVVVSLGVDASITYDAPGTYYVTFICMDDADEFEFTMNPSATTAGDTISITPVTIGRYTTCWKDVPSFSTPSFEYIYLTDGLTYETAYFCSTGLDGRLVNSNAYVNDGYYHGVTFEILNWTMGELNVELGGTSLGTVSGNGIFSLYGIPTDASNELKFTKQNSWDGCIKNVKVRDYGDLSTAGFENYYLYITNSSGTQVCDNIAPIFEQDRLIWCFNIDDLELSSAPTTLTCGLYKLKIYDAENSHTDTSINYFSYSTTWSCSVLMVGHCESSAFDFVFDDVDGDEVFSLKQRLRLLQFNPKYKNTGEEYLYSSGTNTRPYVQSQKIREAWFDKVDEITHDCIRTQLLCDTLTIDGTEFYCPTNDYEPEWAENGKRNLSQSRVELIKVDEKTIFNRYC